MESKKVGWNMTQLAAITRVEQKLEDFVQLYARDRIENSTKLKSLEDGIGNVAVKISSVSIICPVHSEKIAALEEANKIWGTRIWGIAAALIVSILLGIAAIVWAAAIHFGLTK